MRPKIIKYKRITEAEAFNLTFRYTDYVLSIDNPNFANWIPLIYTKVLEIKETTETASSLSFLDIYLNCDTNCQLSIKLYDKNNDYNFVVINFQYINSNIASVYMECIFYNSYFTLNFAVCILDFL